VSQLGKGGSERRGEEEHLPSSPFQQLTRALGAGGRGDDQKEAEQG